MDNLPRYAAAVQYNAAVKLAITGGRGYEDWRAIFDRLDAIHHKTPVTHLFHGACANRRTKELQGADKWCERWAVSREVPYTGEPAQWGKHGNKAGPIRNQLILDKYKPDRGIAFLGGSGTADMILRMKAACIYWNEDTAI